MSLHIYETTESSSQFSEDGEFTNPIEFSVDGRKGGNIEKKYYLRNDDATKTYSSITVQPTDLLGLNMVDGSNGFSIKLKAGDSQPLDQEWDTITAGASISMSNISNTTTYLPFWVRYEIPQGADVQSLDDIRLKTSAYESLV